MIKKIQERQQHFRGATLIEVMIMLILLSFSLLTMYTLLMQGLKLGQDTEMRVRAINIAREGIEGVINIRDTNWLRYSSDRGSCWDTLNYNPLCLTAGGEYITNGSYLLTHKKGAWELESQESWLPQKEQDTNTPDANIQWWRSFDRYRLKIDSSGWYAPYNNESLAPCEKISQNPNDTDCLSQFARDIQITEKEGNGRDSSSFRVIATVHWYSDKKEQTTLSVSLTNWKHLYELD